MTKVTFRRALGLGVSVAFSHAAPVVLLGLAALASTFCTSLLWLQGLAALVDERARTRFFELLVAAATAWLLQAAILGGAVQQFAFGLRKKEVPPLLPALTSAAPRALGWAVLTGAALLAWLGWQVLVGASGWVLFLRGLFHGSGGLTGATALALVATVGPLGACFLQLVVEMALVRSIARDEPPSVALYESAGALLARPWVPVGLLLLTGLLAAVVSGTAAALAGMGGPTPWFRLVRGAAIVQLAIASLASALALLVRLGAFLALELGRSDEIPEVSLPPAPLVPRAELVLADEAVLEARAVEPSPEGGV